MEKNYPATSATAILLQKFLEGNFQNNSFEQNQKLLEELENLQCIIFDRRQRYGNPNYTRVPIEKELNSISVLLRTVLAEQLIEKEFNENVSLEDLFKYFEYAWRINGFFSFHMHCGVVRDEIDERLYNKPKDRIAQFLIKKCSNELEKISNVQDEQKRSIYLKYLKKIIEHYNHSEPISKKAVEIQLKFS